MNGVCPISAFLLRLIGSAIVVYLAVVLALWLFQRSFLYPAPQDPAALTPGYQEVELTVSADNLTLRAFFRPAEEGLPTVVYFHGNGGTLAGASVSNAALAEAGFGALLVEYRGYGGNPGAPSELGLYRDGEAALAWLNAQGIDPAQLIIIGNSIGSGVATEMALRHSSAALILVAPFTSLPDAAHGAMPWVPARYLVTDQYRNAEKIAQLDRPILIQHGDADTLIPDSHGKALAALARSAEFQSFAGSGHDLSFERRSQIARRDWILALDTGV